MWFIQMWILAYFKEFHRFTTFPFGKNPKSYGELYASVSFNRMSFETCLQFFYTQPRDIHDDFFSPFIDARLLVPWVQDLISAQTLSPTQSGAWLEILSAKEIFLGTFHANYKKCSSEIYCPAQFARQLGYFQHIPIPYFSRSNNPPTTRLTHIPKDAVVLGIRRNYELRSSYQEVHPPKGIGKSQSFQK